MATAVEIGPVTNGALKALSFELPFIATVTIVGTADILFHRWNCEEVEAKALAKKGSAAKKTDNIESYVYRNEGGEICIPGEDARSLLSTRRSIGPTQESWKSAMDSTRRGWCR